MISRLQSRRLVRLGNYGRRLTRGVDNADHLLAPAILRHALAVRLEAEDWKETGRIKHFHQITHSLSCSSVPLERVCGELVASTLINTTSRSNTKVAWLKSYIINEWRLLEKCSGGMVAII